MVRRLGDGHLKAYCLSLILTSQRKCTNGLATCLKNKITSDMKYQIGRREKEKMKKEQVHPSFFTRSVHPLLVSITFNIGADSLTLPSAPGPTDTPMVIAIPTSYASKPTLNELLITNYPILQSLISHSLSRP